jgi:hypothetical protein
MSVMNEVPGLPDYDVTEALAAPDWMVEKVAELSRLMHSSPRSVADGIWQEIHVRLALELKEQMEFQNDALVRQMKFRLVHVDEF